MAEQPESGQGNTQPAAHGIQGYGKSPAIAKLLLRYQGPRCLLRVVDPKTEDPFVPAPPVGEQSSS